MTKMCSIPDCEGKHYARRWCAKHYRRWLAHGDPEITARRFTMNEMCGIPDCVGKVHARGWCMKHYRRWRRHGDPETLLLGRVDEYLEEARRLLALGETPENISRRLGVSVAAISVSAYRRGDHDLAAPFARIQYHDRKAKTT